MRIIFSMCITHRYDRTPTTIHLAGWMLVIQTHDGAVSLCLALFTEVRAIVDVEHQLIVFFLKSLAKVLLVEFHLVWGENVRVMSHGFSLPYSSM